jgi:predicted outer membrane repeat protein
VAGKEVFIMKDFLLSLIFVSVLIFSIDISPALAKTWHVPGDASTIQGGINIASAGDTVLVACGTYNDHDITMKSRVRLLSATGQPGCVTIDAQQQGRVFYCRFSAPATRIEGFTITGGSVPYSPDEGNGGGIYCLDNSSPWIVNCIITDNFADWNGGGVCCNSNSSAKFVDCIVTNNEAGNGGSGMMFNNNSDAILTNCTISDNVGNGIWTGNFSAPELTNCTVSGNEDAGIRHQGPPFGTPANIILTDCTISNNTGNSGGGFFFWNADGELTNCSLTGNSSADGGGMLLNSASVTVTNCSFSSNKARSQGGAVFLENGSYLAADTTDFENNKASGNGEHGYVNSGCELVLTCSVPDLTGFAGSGTITLNYDGCFSPVEPTTWGRLKALYR